MRKGSLVRDKQDGSLYMVKEVEGDIVTVYTFRTSRNWHTMPLLKTRLEVVVL